MHTGIGVNAGMRVNMGSQVLQGPQLLLVGVVLLAAALVLQVFLSRRKSLWPGLILPVACGVYALGTLLTFSRVPAGTGAFLLALVMLLPVMITAALLLAVYALCRRSRRTEKKEES